MNIKTNPVSRDEYKLIRQTLETGYTHKGINHRPNHRVSMAVQIMYEAGVHIEDLVYLSIYTIERDDRGYYFNLLDKKARMSNSLFYRIEDFCSDGRALIVGGTTVGVRKQLKTVSEYLGIDLISSMSFIKGHRKEAGNG